MKKILFPLVLFLSFNGFGQTKITKNLEDFTVLKIYSGIHLELIKSEEQKIVITGEKAASIKIKNVHKILRISYPVLKTPSESKEKVVIYYSKNINIIDANEGASITAKEFKQQSVEIKSQENALVNMVINTKHLKVKSVTGGIIKLTGKTKNEAVEVSSGGLYYGNKLVTENLCKVTAGLGGKAEVSVGETLDAKVNFGGTVFYKGTPEVLKTKKVLGGTIEAQN